MVSRLVEAGHRLVICDPVAKTAPHWWRLRARRQPMSGCVIWSGPGHRPINPAQTCRAQQNRRSSTYPPDQTGTAGRSDGYQRAHSAPIAQRTTPSPRSRRKSPQARSGVKCDAIDGLIKETDGIIKEASGVALDACLIACAQAVEHYEIARYGALREWAKVLGHTEAHDLLSQILDMEKAANSKLTGVAVGAVNLTKATS